MSITSNQTVIPEASLFVSSFSEVYALNDEGHRESHFQSVETLAKKMNDFCGLHWDGYLICSVAYLHDLFAWSRTNHHQLSALWVRSTDHYLMEALHPSERELIAKACEEHRASYQGRYSSSLSELMSSADRGECLDIKDQLLRAYIYSVQTLGMSNDMGLERAVKHQKEKFGRNGYARFPEIYRTYFATELEERYQRIDDLNAMTLTEVHRFLA